MMFAAIITLAAMSMSFVSCGDDDDDDPVSKYSTYYLTTEADCGSLDEVAAAQLKRFENETEGQYASDNAAIAMYEKIVEQSKSVLETGLAGVYLISGGKNDFALYIRLYNADRKLLKSTKFSYEE